MHESCSATETHFERQRQVITLIPWTLLSLGRGRLVFVSLKIFAPSREDKKKNEDKDKEKEKVWLLFKRHPGDPGRALRLWDRHHRGKRPRVRYRASVPRDGALMWI